MSSERAWVAKLSCDHSIGSVPPPVADVDPPGDSVYEARMAYMGHPTGGSRALPSAPPFIDKPDEGDLWWCVECHEGRWVVGIVENRDEPTPGLDEKRARR